ncbi:MAG: hypothetical protein JXA66_05280, partial [Oligoflexia bacterium]|nr:hypothetical protein [Oligoflexia bacterium]
VMLYGDPLFSFTRGIKPVFDSGVDTRLSRLLALKRIIEQKNYLPAETIEKLLGDRDEKIRFEVFNWLRRSSPREVYRYSGKLMLDPSDRVFVLFVESLVSAGNRNIVPLMKKNREYFKSQGDGIRAGILEKGLKILSSSGDES